MTYRWNNIAKLSALGGCCSLALWISSTSAKVEETSVLVNKPEATTNQGPVLPPPANPNKPTTDLFAPQQSHNPTTTQPTLKPTQILPPPPRTNSTVKRPFMQPAQPREPARGQLTGQSEPMPAPAEAPAPTPLVRDPNVHPAPPIVYDTDHDARKMYRSGQVQLVMVTQDPSDGCCYEIPLCIPACCVGEPRISGGRGLLGRGVVEYCWSCGFKAKVKFRHVLGDVKVEYEGD
jgi:hypothetical protein